MIKEKATASEAPAAGTPCAVCGVLNASPDSIAHGLCVECDCRLSDPRVALALYRALSEYVAEIDCPRLPTWEWSNDSLLDMRAALAKARGAAP